MATLAILVTGGAGAGKSDLAEKLAALLGSPVIAFDNVLEDLADIAGPTVGRAALEPLAASTGWSLAALIPHGVVVDVATFASAAAGAATGADRIVEIWCEVPAGEAALRIAGRERHPIHAVDAAHPENPAHPDAEPSGLWPLLRVNTRVPVDFTTLLPALAELLVDPETDTE